MEHKLSVTEQELYNLIVSKGEVSITEIQTLLSPKHIGALGKLLRYEKVELSKKYNRRDGLTNKVIKCYVVKKVEEK